MLFNLSIITAWLLHYRYVVLFPLAVIEGPIITVVAGFLSSLGQMNFFLAFVLIVVADLVGDSGFYAFGYFGRKKFIERWGRYVGLRLPQIERIEKHFDSHTGKTLIIGKLSHIVGAPILFAAGLAQIPFADFLWFNFLATLPKSLIFLLIGFYFGRAFVEINRVINYAGLVGAALLIVFILLYAIMIRAIKRYESANEF